MLKRLIFKGLDTANRLYSWSSGTYSDGANTNGSRNKRNAVTPKSIMEELPSFSRWEEVKFCRYLTKNHSIPQAVFSDIVTYTIGGGAIAEFHGGTTEWQRENEQAFSDWSKHCSADRRDGLVDMGQIILWAMLRDGEVFSVFSRRDGETEIEREPLIQICETHVFRDNSDTLAAKQDEFIDGVRYSIYGEAMEYRTITGELISAANVLHICEPRRAGELRCGPMWAGEINPQFDSKELALLAGTGFKNQLIIPVIIDRPPGSSPNPLLGTAAAASGADDAAVSRFESVTGVKIFENRTVGGGVHMSKPEYPGPYYSSIQETYARALCATVYSWPFDFTNLTNKTGTTQRTVLEKATRISENIQKKRLDPFFIRAARQWLAWRIETGQTQAVEGWWKVSFRYPRAATIDMGRDTTSDSLELAKGMQSIPEYFARYQQDWRHEFQKNADALGITFDQYRRLWIAQNFGEEALARLDGVVAKPLQEST